MNWKEIITEQDQEQFLETAQSLHDSCIVQAVYTPDTYVEESGAMQPINAHSQLDITLQQQILGGGRNTIHLRFEEIVLFRLFPRPPRYDSIIYDCTLQRRDGLFYWADFHTSRIDVSFGSIDLSDPGRDAGTWVWRERCSGRWNRRAGSGRLRREEGRFPDFFKTREFSPTPQVYSGGSTFVYRSLFKQE